MTLITNRTFLTTRTRQLLAIWGLIFVTVQFFGPWRTNPLVVESHSIRSQLQIPSQISDTMNRACMDCHSYETRWPWYSAVAPVRWWLVDHVNMGRRELNLSEWKQYQPAFAIATLGSMAEAVKRDAMPPTSYIALHPQARLSKAESTEFCDWTQAQKRRMQNVFLRKAKAQN